MNSDNEKPIKIIINNDNKNSFLEANKFFLNEIKYLYELFKNDYYNFKEKWKNHDEYFMLLERAKYTSPITIFDAYWGQGKTYFFEELIFNCFVEKNIDIKNDYDFDNIIIIDLWEYMNDDEMINNIVYDLYKKLLPNDQIMKDLLKKIIKNCTKGIGIILANIFTNGNLGLSFETDNEVKNIIKDIKERFKELKKTIVIFDNVERLEDKSVDIIKLIQKVSYIDNLMIILPMNRKEFIFDKDNGNEYKIDKYITLDNYFKFEQDFIDVLRNKKINEKYINLINELLKIPNNGNILSIRKLKKRLNTTKINDELKISKYNGIKFLDKNIWHCKEKIKEIIKNDCNNALTQMRNLEKHYNEWTYNNKQQYYNQIVNNFFDSWDKEISSLLFNKDKNYFLFNDFSNFFEKIENYIEQIKNKNNNNIIKNLSLKVKKLEQENDRLSKSIDEFDKKIEISKEEINKIEAIGADMKEKDISNSTKLEIKIEKYKKSITEKANKKEDNLEKIKSFLNDIKRENSNINTCDSIVNNINELKDSCLEIANLLKDNDFKYLFEFITNEFKNNYETTSLEEIVQKILGDVYE